MDEMYILHELHNHEPPEEECNQDLSQNELLPETNTEITPETVEPILELVLQCEPLPQPDPEPIPPYDIIFEPIEEPGPNWEMELAQAYVRAQPLDGVFPPEKGLIMGTAFPNLSKPYTGRD